MADGSDKSGGREREKTTKWHYITNAEFRSARAPAFVEKHCVRGRESGMVQWYGS